MIQNLIRKLLARRHFWRYATFSEISELYASRMLRMMALNIAASFMSIFLYQNGYSVLFITLFWASFYMFKFLVALPGAVLVAYVGPKHAILISNLLYIPSMVLFALLPTYGVWLLPFIALLQGFSSILYSIGHGVDFSKVKSIDHAGKEIAYMNIFEKLATALSPLVGGFLALLVGPVVVILVAAILFALAALPLFKTAEPILPRQKLVFRGLPWKLVTRNIAADSAEGFDTYTSGTVWSLFVAILIIGVGTNNNVYAINGILLSFVVLAALGASYAYGKLIDRRRGKYLLRFASIGNALVHLSRPFITSTIGVAGLNIANEAATTGYTMAFTRGYFDAADLSGSRVTYIGIMEGFSNFGAGIAALALAGFVILFGVTSALHFFFFLAAAVVLLVITQRFPLYQK